MELTPWSEGANPFRPNLKSTIASVYKDRGARKIIKEDHSFLMEAARQRTALEYVSNVYAVVEEDEEGGENEDVSMEGDSDEFDSDEEE